MSDVGRASEREGPFPGFGPFTDADADYFFGRSDEGELVLDHLLAHRISVLFGPGGVGKSSLLMAYVLPRLRELGQPPRPGRPGRRVAGRHDAIVCPAEQLREQLAKRVARAADAPPPDAPLEQLVRAAAQRADGRLLLALDQFEAQLGDDPGEQDLELARAIASAGSSVHVLLAVREDALGRLERLSPEIPGLFDHLIPLKHLAPDAGRNALREPVRVWNERHHDDVEIDDELVERILRDTRIDDTRSVQVPYLQLAIERLWTGGPNASGRLSCDALTRLGGIDGIVDSHVNATLDALSPREQDMAAAMLRVLVTPSGAKVAHAEEDLAGYAAAPTKEVHAVLERLADARLLEPLSGDRYQLYHDGLARSALAWREGWALRRDRRRERWGLFGILAFITVLLSLAATTQMFSRAEDATLDARFVLRGHRTPPSDVVIVRIDDASLAKLRRGWPLPRSLQGDAISAISDGGPRAIAYDIDLSGPAPTAVDDADASAQEISLARAVYGATGRIALAAQAPSRRGQVDVLGGRKGLAALGARVGYAGFRRDDDGVIRHPADTYRGLPSFAQTAAEVALGRQLPGRDHDRDWLDYHGPEGTLPSVPLWRVVRHRLPRDTFRDKVVVVGLTSAAYGDRHPVWGTGHADMSGPEVQATAIDTILRDYPLRSPPWIVAAALVAAFLLLVPLAWLLSHRLRVVLPLTIGVAALYLGAVVLAFDNGVVLPVVIPLAALLLPAVALSLARLVTEPRRPRRP